MYQHQSTKGDRLLGSHPANPDVVEHYSENVVDTLHKKNLYARGGSLPHDASC